MTDDDRIAELFHAAASDAGAPPPRFDHHDVVAVSRRITARRRSAMIGGAVALLVVAGVGTTVALPLRTAETQTAAAPVAGADSAAGPGAQAAPEAAVGGALPPTAGAGDASAPGAPLGPGTTSCANRQDPALRALVVAVLPEATDAHPAATSDICLPGTQRYLSLELGGGVLTVTYLPPGTAPSLSTAPSLRDGTSSAPTASHGTVIVSPAPGYGARVPQLLDYLAPRL